MLVWIADGPEQNIDWIPTPSLHDAYSAAAVLAGGGFVKVLLAGLVVVGVVGFARVFARTHQGRDVWVGSLTVLWLTVPFVVSLAISWIVEPIFYGRYLIVSLPALALLAATAITAVQSRVLAIAAVVLVVAASLASVVDGYGGQQQDWRGAAALLAARATPDDGVVLCPPRRRAPLQHYVNRTLPPGERPRSLSPPVPWDAVLPKGSATPHEVTRWVAGGPERIWSLTTDSSCAFDFDGRTRTLRRDFVGVRVERYDRS
jgi:hypothetical protein